MKIEKIKDTQLKEIARMLKALSEPTRLKIMQTLHTAKPKQTLCVTDIVDRVGTGQANISKHLQVLSQAHLIVSEREGNLIYYSIQSPFVTHLCESICQGYLDIVSQKESK